MKKVFSILIALIIFPSLGLADPGTTWEKRIDGPERFQVLDQFGGHAVFDQETGRVWEQSPETTRRNWTAALRHCYTLEVGGRKGWRLPTIEELTSLMSASPSFDIPSLPAGHPFSNVQPPGIYWSATSTSPIFAVIADFARLGAVRESLKSNATLQVAWCVRGGKGIDGPRSFGTSQ
jgi:uncharacterized protein DUF1566